MHLNGHQVACYACEDRGTERVIATQLAEALPIKDMDKLRPVLESRRRPATTEWSEVAAELPVNPPGNRLWSVKQFGSASTCWRAAASGTLPMIGTAGQPPAPLTPVSAQHPVADEQGREAVDHGAAEDPAAGMRVRKYKLQAVSQEVEVSTRGRTGTCSGPKRGDQTSNSSRVEDRPQSPSTSPGGEAASLTVGLHEPFATYDRLRDPSATDGFEQDTPHCWRKTVGHPRGSRLGPLPSFKEATYRPATDHLAHRLPRATGDGHGAGTPSHAWSRPSSGTPSPCAIGRCWRDQPATPARCQGTHSGEDRTASGPTSPRSCQQRFAKHLRRYRGQPRKVFARLGGRRPTNYSAEQDIGVIAVVNRKSLRRRQPYRSKGHRPSSDPHERPPVSCPSQRALRVNRHVTSNPSCSRQHPRTLGQPRYWSTITSRLPSRQAHLVNTSVLMDASSQHLELALII